jgi:hypothetical protein
MIVEQTVDVPPSRQLYIDVPQEVPVGKAILTFTPVSAALAENIDHAEKIWAYNLFTNRISSAMKELFMKIGIDYLT